MTKGYLGDVCFNGKVLKNHIIYIDYNRNIEKIMPFECECEGVILCDNVLLVIDSKKSNTPEIVTMLQKEYRYSKSYAEFFNLPSYKQYGATEIVDATFIELGDVKPL